MTEILDRVRLGRSVERRLPPRDGARACASSRTGGSGPCGRSTSPRWPRARTTAAIARPIATRDASGRRLPRQPCASRRRATAWPTSPPRDGLFDVFVAATVGRAERRASSSTARTTPSSRACACSRPGWSWSPDGQRLAVAVDERRRATAIALVDVRDRRRRDGPPPGVDAIVSVAWSPDGTRIAFEGTAGAQSDLYVVDLATGGVANLTRDLYSDHAPAWAPDGRSFVFHSDRGDARPGPGDGRRRNRRPLRHARARPRPVRPLPSGPRRIPAAWHASPTTPVWDDTDAALSRRRPATARGCCSSATATASPTSTPVALEDVRTARRVR